MTQVDIDRNEIIEMARQARMMDTWDGWVSRDVYRASGVQTENLEHFAKLVAAKAVERERERIEKQLREEMCYSWVPPHFVDMAIKTCAEKAWITLVKHHQPVEIRQDVTEAILSVGEKDESNKL